MLVFRVRNPAVGADGQGPWMVRRLVVAVHEAVDRLEGMERHLRREARRPEGIPRGRALLACVASLEQGVVGGHLPHTEVREASLQVRALVLLLRGLPLLASAPPVLEGLQRGLREDLDGGPQALGAVAHEEPRVGRLLPQEAVPAQEHRAQPADDEDRVGVHLDDPVRAAGVRVLHDAAPEVPEHPQVRGVVELALRDPVPAPVDEVGPDDGHLAPGREQDGGAAVDGEGVAAEDADPAAPRVLRAHQVHLVPLGLHRHGAEELRLLGGRGAHGLHDGLRRFFRRIGVDAAVEVLAAALGGHAVVGVVARPLVHAVAALVAEHEVASPRRARHGALRQVLVDRELELLKLLEGGLHVEPLVPLRMLVHPDLDVPHHVVEARGALGGVLTGRRRRRPALLVGGEVLQRLRLARAAAFAARRAGPAIAPALVPQLGAPRVSEAHKLMAVQR
mmetsp:Transcript_88735/g.248263  ORF Transcript_88735/g.248263 Transcript_88735/m.248263 type:complete len:450 (-) Transcript_88735:311-1660(-)